MTNPIKIHINRRFHIPLDNILSVTKKRWGSVWVAFIDEKSNKTKIAIAKTEMSNLLTIINNYRVMRGQGPMIGIYEK